MSIVQSIIEALESLSANKLRSGLTMLGIVIGVGAVIAMLSVGQGAQATITGAISGIGSNLLFVFPGNMQTTVTNPQPLTLEDANAISDPLAAPDVAAVTPVINGNGIATYYNNQTSTQIEGVTANYAQVRNYKTTEGNFISEDDILSRSSVALVGPQVADKLFGRTQGITGETIRIEGQPFRIIGVLESKGGSAFGSQDNVILVPFTTAQARLIQRNRDRADIIYVEVVSANRVQQATDEISQILRTRHRTKIGADDFTIFSQQDFVNTAATITGVFTIFLGGIAAISLLVGGIGIMNIMLVSVTERTREIGLRKAIGARRRDILVQFLTESSLLSLFGGLIGIGLGWLIAFIVGKVAAATGTAFHTGSRLELYPAGDSLLHRGGPVLRHLPGQPRRQPPACRSITLRIN